MSTFLATYDPKSVIIQINGEEVYGFADGDMVTVDKNEEYFANMVGSKGEVTRAKNANDTGLITFRLQHTSPFIQTLMNYAIADEFLSIPPIINITIKDPSSYDNVVAAQCWLQDDGTKSWSNETGVREFTFFAVNVVSGPNQNINAGLAIAATIGLS